MKIIHLLLFILVLYACFEFVSIGAHVFTSSGIAGQAKAFESQGGTRTMLVLGDSTAVGVGADAPEHSVPGILAAEYNLSVENLAKSGAVAADLEAQLARAQADRYNLILIQAGANDVIRLRDLASANADMEAVIREARKKSDRVVILTAGKIGNAPIFPWFLRSLMTARASDLRDMLKATAEAQGAAYVDLFNTPDPFAQDPRRYYARDGLHLSADGYAFWAGEVVGVIADRWPEFLHG